MAMHQQSAFRRAFSGSLPCRRASPVSRQKRVAVRAMLREWSPSNTEFIQATLAEFPETGVANVEQARCLYSNGGYTYLDVRSTLEVGEVGKVKDSVNIPFVHASRVYDSEARKKVVKKEPNTEFIQQIERKFPDKQKAKLLVACSDGRQYSIDALEALDEAGYVNLVGLKGGYRSWFSVWDNKLQRRRYGEYSEQYSHDGDSAGIHSSGAGFEKMDPQEAWLPPSY
eukprot:gene3527-3796_t